MSRVSQVAITVYGVQEMTKTNTYKNIKIDIIDKHESKLKVPTLAIKVHILELKSSLDIRKGLRIWNMAAKLSVFLP